MYPSIPVSQIISGYTDAMNWLANATSRPIVVFVKPISSGCPNNLGFDPVLKSAQKFYNPVNPFSTGITVIASLGISGILNIPFPSGTTCPVCMGHGFLYSPTSGTINARIQYRNKMSEFAHEETKIKSDDYKVRIKVTGSYAIDLLDRAEKVVIDGNNSRIVESKVPVGLRDIHTYYYYLNDLQ